MGEIRKVCKILVIKHDGKNPLGRPMPKLEDNIIVTLRIILWGDVDWIHVAQDEDQWRDVVSMVMKLRVP
jgi:hypothetical protein